jgi:hypothetical protein
MSAPPNIELHDDGYYLTQHPLGAVKLTGQGWFVGHLGAWHFIPDTALVSATCTDDVLSIEATPEAGSGKFEYHRRALDVLRLAVEGDRMVVRDP